MILTKDILMNRFPYILKEKVSPEDKILMKKEKMLLKYKKTLLKHFNLDLDKFKPKLKGGVMKTFQKSDILKVPLSELIRGIKVEKEHTDNVYLRMEIALGHLLEKLPNSLEYYKKLKACVEND